MARMNSSLLPITGRLGDLSLYRIKGSDEIFVRRKGGVSKKRIRTDPAYDMTRRQNSEFTGRALCFKTIRLCFPQLRTLVDRLSAGRFSKLTKLIQELDDKSELGKRNIYLSRHSQWLEGFNFNTRFPFESIITAPIHFQIDRNQRNANVIIPELIHGINFFQSEQHSHYRFIIVLSFVPDICWTRERYRQIASKADMTSTAVYESEWFGVKSGSREFGISLALQSLPLEEDHALVLAVGIQFGAAQGGDLIRPVKYGNAKVIGAR